MSNIQLCVQKSKTFVNLCVTIDWHFCCKCWTLISSLIFDVFVSNVRYFCLECRTFMSSQKVDVFILNVRCFYHECRMFLSQTLNDCVLNVWWVFFLECLMVFFSWMFDVLSQTLNFCVLNVWCFFVLNVQCLVSTFARCQQLLLLMKASHESCFHDNRQKKYSFDFNCLYKTFYLAEFFTLYTLTVLVAPRSFLLDSLLREYYLLL